MVPEALKRKLSAILNADVEGYSRLIRGNEETTIRTLTTYRGAMTSLIQKYRGRVVDAPGDNLLAEFASVVDAVQCAVEIQRDLAERNAELPAKNKMAFRIGVNLGDIVEEDGRIYGDGVNIAARLENICQGGGICISRTAYEHIKHKVDFEFEDFGEHKVKNITEPLRVYRVLSHPGAAAHRVVKAKRAIQRKWRKAAFAFTALLVIGAAALTIWNFFLRTAPATVDPASRGRMAFPLPDKPSIAVLPFVNISGDKEQEYFSDGITEDLITDISKIAGLLVIARNSTFAYKGKAVKIRHVAEELGVRYVLEGSVRKAGEKIRINAQLIDAVSGHHLWAERYDGRLDDVFALQDKVTEKIVAALALKLTLAEREQVLSKETDNILAYDAYLKGMEYYRRFTPDDLIKAIAFFEKAVELEPNYGRAYAAMALVYWRAYAMAWHSSLAVGWYESRLRARQYLQMAMTKPTSLVHQLASQMNLYQRLYQEAIAEAERAIALDPNDPGGLSAMAEALIFEGRPDKAVEFVKRAMRIDPHNSAPYNYLLGLAHFAMGQIEEAVAFFKSALALRPEAKVWSAALAATYGYLGRYQEAQATMQGSIAGRGWYMGDTRLIMYFYPFKDAEVGERLAEGFRNAGYMEHRVGYYRLAGEDRLTAGEINDLVFGQKAAGSDGFIDRAKDGKATLQRGVNSSESGTSWIQDDMLCNQWQTYMQGLKYCAPVFRNPEGTPESLDEYITITDYGFVTFSPVD